MQKKTLNNDIWDILDYGNEDYREFIREAGFDPDELYKDFGRFVDELDELSSTIQNNDNYSEFYEWLESRAVNDQVDGLRINELFNSLKTKGRKVEECANVDPHLAVLFDVFLKEKGVTAKN